MTLVSDEPVSTGRGRAFALMAGAVAVGSVSFTLIELVLRDLTPNALAAGRVVASAIAFITVVTLQPRRRRSIEPRDRVRVVLCGLGGSAGFHLLFSAGQDRVTVAVSAVVLGTMPAMVAALEWLFLHHRLTRSHAVGLVLSVLGIVVISWGAGGSGGDGSSTPLGIALVAASTLVWASVTVATRSVADRYDAWWLNTPGTVLGAIVMLVVVAPRAGGFSGLSVGGWLMVVWLGAVGSAFVYAALTGAMQVLSATTTASLATLVTPVSILVAWVVLDETPTVASVVGSAVVVVGVVFVTREGPGSISVREVATVGANPDR